MTWKTIGQEFSVFSSFSGNKNGIAIAAAFGDTVEIVGERGNTIRVVPNGALGYGEDERKEEMAVPFACFDASCRDFLITTRKWWKWRRHASWWCCKKVQRVGNGIGRKVF